MCLKGLLLDSTTIEKCLYFKTEYINLVNEIEALHSYIPRLACPVVLLDVQTVFPVWWLYDMHCSVL